MQLELPLPQQSHQEIVREFQRMIGQVPKPQLYIDLIEEECDEFWEAIDTRLPDVEVLKEMADILVVLYGYAEARGFDLDQAFKRVMANNAGRCIQPDGSIKRREDGKVLKNPDYPKVNLSDLVQ